MLTKTATRRAWAPMMVAIALIVVIGACGDDDGGNAEPTTAPTATDTTSPSSTSTTTESTTETPTTAPSTTEPPPTSEPSGQSVQVYFSIGDGTDCSLVAGFDRSVSEGSDPIRAAFDQLVAGPSDEEAAAGAVAFFSSATADAVSSVTLRDGLLVVDFVDLRPLIPNASTSCGSAALRAQLNNTAFQFTSVERVRYLIEGSCDTFANWLQSECFDLDRAGTAVAVPTNERASGSGCTPPSGDGLPDGRWFGFVDETDERELAFDLACWFTGTAAATAAAEDGEESPPPNDYHIRNANDRVRPLAVSSSAEVAWLTEPGNPQSLIVIPYPEWRIARSARPYQPGVWLVIEAAQIVSIEEQFVP